MLYNISPMARKGKEHKCTKWKNDAQDASAADLQMLQMLDRLAQNHHALSGAIADARTAQGNLNELRARLSAKRQRLQQLQKELTRTEKAIISDEASADGLSLMKLHHSQHVAGMCAAFGDAVKLLLNAPVPDRLKDALRLEIASLQQCKEATYPAAIQRIMTIVHWLREQCEMRVAPTDPFVIPEEPEDTTPEIVIPPPSPEKPSPKKTTPPQDADIEHIPVVKAASVPPLKTAKPQTREHREQLRVQISWMIRRNMPEILHIEQQSFKNPWTEEDFLKCLRQRNHIGMVAEHGEKVISFMIYELHNAKLHILDFAVHPDNRDRGIGRQMVAKLIGKLSSHYWTRITLDIRETNTGGQLFFRKQGFLARKVLPNYYEDTGEDAFLMEYRMPGTEDELDGEGLQSVNRITPYLDEQPEPPPPLEEPKPPDGDDDDPMEPVRK